MNNNDLLESLVKIIIAQEKMITNNSEAIVRLFKINFAIMILIILTIFIELF